MIYTNEALIYMLINKKNGKIYIGKTKKHYGDAEHSAMDRFKAHVRLAMAYKDKCSHLYNAIRKWGAENFEVKVLLECPLEQVDEFEIESIEAFDATNRKIGYNIALGGGGRSVVKVSEEARKNISIGQGKDEDDEMNIKPYYEEGELHGYIVTRRERGKVHTKWYTSTENTPEENLALARKWLEELKNGTLVNVKHNKKSKLPKNVSIVRHKKTKEIVGYRVNITVNGKAQIKNFQLASESLETKLQKAVEWRDKTLQENVREDVKNE